MELLKLRPLVCYLRRQVERGEIPLEESVRKLAYASELVAAKLRFLLPGSLPGVEGPDQENSAADAVEYAEDSAGPEALSAPLLDKDQLQRASRLIADLIESGSRYHWRGLVSLPGEGQSAFYQVSTVSTIDPAELAQVLRELEKKRASGPKLVVSRWNFIAHLRNFWRQVRQLASRHMVLRFSVISGKTRAEKILSFLALLELVKRRRILARQAEVFGDIIFSIHRRPEGSREGD